MVVGSTGCKMNFKKNRNDVEEKTKEILGLYNKGLTINKISRLMACDFSVIKRILLKNEIKIRQINHYNEGKNNYMFQKHHSEGTKEKIRNSEYHKNLEGKNHPFFEKHHSEGTKEKIRNSEYHKNLKGKNSYWFGKKNPYLSLRNVKDNPAKRPEVKEKIRESAKLRIGEKNPFYGKSHSEETRKKLSEANSGEKASNWLGGLSFEPYGIEFNNKFKRAIRKRDNQVCMLCGIHREKLNKAFFIHHINYDKKLSIPQNCISLCSSCHSKTNFGRKHWTKFFQSLLSERYNYQYSEMGEIILGTLK